MITLDELERNVAAAALDVCQQTAELLPGESELNAIVRLSGMPVGHVRDVLDKFDVQWFGGDFGFTKQALDKLEAYVRVPIAQPKQHASNFTINTTGDGNQLQVGNEVSGSQTMASYQQVLEVLEQQVERSTTMTVEQKKSALQKLKEFASLPGISQVLVAGANGVVDLIKHTMGG